MGISKYNSEGYADPTAYEAVLSIEKEAKKWRPLVYICSPYSGDVDAASVSSTVRPAVSFSLPPSPLMVAQQE